VLRCAHTTAPAHSHAACFAPCLPAACSAPSYHTIPGKALAAHDLKDGQQLTTVSQHTLTVKVDK
jgi:hypothetical protein